MLNLDDLTRTYRLGQQLSLQWVFDRLLATEPNQQLAFDAVAWTHRLSFTYIDAIVEQAIIEYETERERWQTVRGTERTALLDAVLSGQAVPIDQGEAILDCPLRGHHVGAVLWIDDVSNSPYLTALEMAVRRLRHALQVDRRPFYWPHDPSTAWVWLPVGGASSVESAALAQLSDIALAPVRVVLGSVAAGTPGGDLGACPPTNTKTPGFPGVFCGGGGGI